MNLSPTNATAIAPRAWDTTAAKRRQAERLSGIEHIVCKIIGGLEKNIRHGLTDDNVTAIVNQWAGPLAKFVRVEGLRSQVSGFRSQPSGLKSRTLRLQAKHPAVIMELRSRLPALKAALKGTGIEEVRL